jgi:hypothetical protein
MSNASETSSVIIAPLFRDPDAILGTKWLKPVDLGWTEASLHSQAIDMGTLSVTKTK